MNPQAHLATMTEKKVFVKLPPELRMCRRGLQHRWRRTATRWQLAPEPPASASSRPDRRK